jgi:hypothetical protein
MHMIGHEHPAMNRNIKSLSALRQPMGVRRKICVTGENCLPVVAALDNVDWISGGTESCTSWHRSLCLIPERPYVAVQIQFKRSAISVPESKKVLTISVGLLCPFTLTPFIFF